MCGSRFINFHCNQVNGFANEWEKGNVPFYTALRASNTESSRTVMQALIAADAMPHPGPTRCPLLTTALGDNACAKSYFTDRWLSSGEWQEGSSGKENMSYSSYMYRVGCNITRNDRALFWHP